MSIGIQRSLMFFDLAGTLLHRGQLPDAATLGTLQAVKSRAAAVVLVTGQPSEDPQVIALCRGLIDGPGAFIAYTTRGGCRWVGTPGGLRRDDAYLHRTSLPPDRAERISQDARTVCGQLGVKLLIPPAYLDGCAVRLNVDPAVRAGTVEQLCGRFPDLNVVSEGRTSIFIMNQEIGKRFAVTHELSLHVDQTAHYFGNEFDGGNDEELLDIPGLRRWGVGDTSSTEDRYRVIAESPVALIRQLDSWMEAEYV